MILECCPGAVLVSWANVDTISKTAALLDAEIVDLYMLELEDLPIMEFVVTVTLGSVARFVGSIVDTVVEIVALLSAETVDLYLVTDIDDGSPCLSVESELVVPV